MKIPNAPATFAPPGEEVGRLHSFRLVTFEECKEMIGYRSRTSVYSEIESNPDFPRPIYRGRNVYFAEDEIIGYLEKLRAQRDSQAQAERIEAAKAAARVAIAGKTAKRTVAAATKVAQS